MFLWVLPALIVLLVFFWLRDWTLRVVTKWKRAAEKKYDLMKEDRWFVILEMMKIIMFLALLFPLVAVINYATNENATDPAPDIFTETMPLVFIIITAWYLAAIVLYGIYWRNKQDKEREKDRIALKGEMT